MLTSSRLLRKKQPVNYKPAPLNRSLTADDVIGSIDGRSAQIGVSPNHRDKVVTEDGRVFFPCPYCSRAFTEKVNRAIHLNTCSAKSYILSVAIAVKPEEPFDHKKEDESTNSITTPHLLEKTHSFSEEEQSAFLQAIQLAKVNDIISGKHYKIVVDRIGHSRQTSPPPLLSHVAQVTAASENSLLSQKAVSNKANSSTKSVSKNTIPKKKSSEPKLTGSEDSSTRTSVTRKSVTNSKTVPTQKPKQDAKKTVTWNMSQPIPSQKPISTPSSQQKSKSASGKAVVINNSPLSPKTKQQGINGPVPSKKVSVSKKPIISAKASQHKPKSSPKNSVTNKNSNPQSKAPGKVAAMKSFAKSPHNVTKVNASKGSKNAMPTKQSKVQSSNAKNVIAKKSNSKVQKPKKISPKKKTLSKRIVITPSIDMNALEKKIADLVNLISGGNNSRSPRLSLKKDEKTGSLVITTETEISQNKTATKRPSQDSHLPAKKRKANDGMLKNISKPQQSALVQRQSTNETVSTGQQVPQEEKKSSSDKLNLGHESIHGAPKEINTVPISNFIESKVAQTDSVQNGAENIFGAKENEVPINESIVNKSVNETMNVVEVCQNIIDPKEISESKTKPDMPDSSKSKSSLPKIVLKSQEKKRANIKNKTEPGSKKKVNTKTAKVRPDKAAVTGKNNNEMAKQKSKGTITKLKSKRLGERNLKQTIDKIVKSNASISSELVSLPSLDEVACLEEVRQDKTMLSLVETEEKHGQNPTKQISEMKKVLAGKRTKPVFEVSESENSQNTERVAYNSLNCEVVAIPTNVNIRNTRSRFERRQMQSSQKATVPKQPTTQQKQIIEIEEEIIDLDEEIIVVEETPENKQDFIDETPAATKPLTDEELLSLLALRDDVQVECIIQKPIARERSSLPTKNVIPVQTKPVESVRNIRSSTAKQKTVAKSMDNMVPSTSKVAQASLIQELILNNIPRDDMHPKKLESYIKQFAMDFAAATKVVGQSTAEKTQSDTQNAEKNPQAIRTTIDAANESNNVPQSSTEVNKHAIRSVRPDEECEGDEMEPLLLEDEEEGNSDNIVQSPNSLMGPTTCKYCLEQFNNPIDLLRHKRLMHNFPKILLSAAKVEEYMNTDDYSRCPVCQKPFTLHPSSKARNKWAYIKHLRTHSKDLNFTCSKCHRKFKRQDHMKAHEKRHF